MALLGACLAIGTALPALVVTGAFQGRASEPAATAGVRLALVGSFRQPVFVTAPAGDRRRLFVVEQEGRVRVVRDGRVLRRPFLDLTPRVRSGGERGLLSMAFAPDYDRSGRFYVFFTDRRGDLRVLELRRSARDPDRADPGPARDVLSQRHRRFPNHNGGQLAFGPDRLLYVGFGDGGGGGDSLGSAQDLGSRLGKILRIDPRPGGGRPYRIPPDNPFAARPGARPEVFAYGLRNPHRFSFDRGTGDLVIGDVGQEHVEEVTHLPRGRGSGANLGWNRFEGRRRFAPGTAPGHVPPVIERLHAQGDCSVTGGYVVRDARVAALRGRYLYGDFCTGMLRAATLGPGGAEGDRALGLTVPSLASFGEDGVGRVYAVSLEGPVLRVAPR
jgi:glucose/arabinose dehydrogenase